MSAVASNFSIDQLSVRFATIAKKAMESTDQSATARFDVVDAVLRNIILEHCEATWSETSALNELLQAWNAAISICIHLLTSEKVEGCRKLPFVILEDIVEALVGQTLKDFWTQAKPADCLCQSILWAPTKTNLHVLQFIKTCNRLLARFKGQDEWVGLVMLDLARVLPLSDKSSTKIYGSVSASLETAIDDSQEVDSSLDYSLYYSFWSVQQDFANPYKIEFGVFVNKMRAILSGLEGTSNEKLASGSLDYLTGARIFPVQLQDTSLKVHVLTQFLITEAFLSSQSPNLKSTLQTLAKRAKDLLNKMCVGDYSTNLDWLLIEREEFWRTWKQNKCKPGFLESTPTIQTDTENLEYNLFVNNNSNEEDDFLKTISMADLGEVSKKMGKSVPDVFVFLDDYKDALDPNAGIEAEYHPKNDKLYSWRAMRLLSKNYLGDFNLVQKETGDFENLVRHIYRTAKNIHIPGLPLPAARVGSDGIEDQVAKEQTKNVDSTQMEHTEVEMKIGDGDDVSSKHLAALSVDEPKPENIETVEGMEGNSSETLKVEDEPHEPIAEEVSKVEVEASDDYEAAAVNEERYAGMDAMERAMAEEEDQLDRDNQKRESQAAKKEMKQEAVVIDEPQVEKHFSEKEASTGKGEKVRKHGDVTELKRKRATSPPHGRDVRPRFGQSGGADKHRNARGKLTSNTFPISRGNSGPGDSRGIESQGDDTRRPENRNGPPRENTRRRDTQSDENRGGRENRGDVRDVHMRGDQRRELSRDDRRNAGMGNAYRDDVGASGNNSTGPRDGEYRRGR